MQENEFSKYNLSGEIIEVLTMLKMTKPTPIQEQVIPIALRGNDIIAMSKTGSGKTAAFGIPICEKINWEENAPQALVLEPTRELAYQVKDELFNIGRMKRIKVPVIFGGFPFDKQAQTLKQKSHVVVGTPGRILDHCINETLCCDRIQYVIIDEADLMLDMGFLEDVKKILAFLPKGKTIMMFSATMGQALYSLAEEFMVSPKEIMLESKTKTADTIVQEAYLVTDENKYDVFLDVLIMEKPKNAIIFCGTREMTEVLYYKLKKEKIWSGMLHGLIDQKVRMHTIEEFRAHEVPYLIATDVAARGVDFDSITHVINYDLPTSKETYVHRIGRTGRNGKTGKAISFVREDEQKMFDAIQTYTNAPIAIKTAPDQNQVEKARSVFDSALKVKQARKQKKGDVFNQQIMKLAIGGGKKSKLRTCEVVGTICSIDGISGNEDIGVIDIQDSMTTVEILNGKGELVLRELPKRTMKGKCRKVSRAN